MGVPDAYQSKPDFTGHVADPETGLIYMQARYYDPFAGRFLAMDPMPASDASFNRYWYANNNPYKFVDPDGRMGCAASRIDAVCERYGMTGAASTIAHREITQTIYTVRDTPFAPWHGWNGFKDAITCWNCGLPGNGSFEATLAAFPVIPMVAAPARAATAASAVGGTTTVYRSINAAGQVQYVGITNNLLRRSAEHLRDRAMVIYEVMGGLSRSDARAVEQALIVTHGLGKNGGTLLNRINSISPLNPVYKEQLARGYELLQSVGR